MLADMGLVVMARVSRHSSGLNRDGPPHRVPCHTTRVCRIPRTTVFAKLPSGADLLLVKTKRDQGM
jgi:hypothetical protein